MVEFLKFFLPIAGAVIAWFWNERRKKASEDYVRKEKKYEALIEGLRGFYTHTSGSQEGRELKNRFLLELNKSWLYCPDEVIGKIYDFTATVHTDKKCTDDEKERAVGELMLAIRKDLLSHKPVKETKLKATDFKHLTAN